MTTVPYPDDTLVVFAEMAAKSILAYPNDANVAQSLTLGASSNLVLQASNNGTVSLQTSAGEYLRFAKGSNATTVAATSTIALSPGDSNSTVVLGDMQLTYDNTHTYQVVSAQASNGIYMPNTLTLGSNLVIGGTMATMSSFASRDVSVFKAFTPPTGCNTDIIQVGYTLQINDSNQNLQVVRYNKYQNNTTSYTVVATFGMDPNVGLVPAPPTDRFNQMSLSLPVVSGGGGGGPIVVPSNVLPRAAMTANVCTLQDGQYTASASTAGSNYYAFDYNSNTVFTTDHTYEIASGNANGTIMTTSYTNGMLYGEWVQLDPPSATAISSYSIAASLPGFDDRSPKQWMLLGSNSSGWAYVDFQNGQSGLTTTPTTFTLGSNVTYDAYRLVVQITNGATNMSLSGLYFGLA